MIRNIANALPMIEAKLKGSPELIELMSAGKTTDLDSIDDQFTYAGYMSLSQVSEINNALTFLTLSLNQVAPTKTSYAGLIKVGIAVDNSLSRVIPLALEMFLVINKIMTSNTFGLPAKPTLIDLTETYFDSSLTVLGYTALYRVQEQVEITDYENFE